MDVTVIDVIKQMSYVIPSIIAATMALTSAIHGIFKIEKDWVNHLISWLLAVASAEAFVACNGLTFGLGGWDYAVAAVCGLITGAASNGIYDWEKIKYLFDLITKLFGGDTVVVCDTAGICSTSTLAAYNAALCQKIEPTATEPAESEPAQAEPEIAKSEVEPAKKVTSTSKKTATKTAAAKTTTTTKRRTTKKTVAEE